MNLPRNVYDKVILKYLHDELHDLIYFEIKEMDSAIKLLDEKLDISLIRSGLSGTKARLEEIQLKSTIMCLILNKIPPIINVEEELHVLR